MVSTQTLYRLLCYNARRTNYTRSENILLSYKALVEGGVVRILVFQACLMSFYLHFIAFDFLYVAEFFCGMTMRYILCQNVAGLYSTRHMQMAMALVTFLKRL